MSLARRVSWTMENNNNWTFPPGGFVKINVHGAVTIGPLPNGNTSGIGVVIRDDGGKIIAMISGTIGELDRKSNNLYAILVGLRRAFRENKQRIILEIDDRNAYNEWRNSRQSMPPERSYVLGQLNRRIDDPNMLELEVRYVPMACNGLAIYLARNGVETRTRLVDIASPFGRVYELWCYDMGLGPVEPRFWELDEEDQNTVQGEP